MRRLLAGVVALCLTTTFAFAQSGSYVRQSGASVTPNTVPYWVTNGVIGGGVTAADSPVTSFGVTTSGQSGICANSARESTGGWLSLCQGYVSGIPTISVQNYGSASAQPLQFIVNGTTYAFPGSLADITIGTTPVVGGTNSECLFVSSGVVGQQTCQLSAITSLTGDATATGPGVAALTLATVNANTGTFGSGLLIPIITVNSKGLITAVSTASSGLIVGSSTIASGATNAILYQNGTVLGEIGVLGSAVLSTNSGGTPSLSKTLPTGLAIPGPTFSGTVTFPDAASWTSTGISEAAAISVGSAMLPSGGDVSISGQYQINGTQIAASNLSNGVTGSGSVVLAASPTLSGTVAGGFTLSGNLTLSGNDTHSGQTIFTGTSAPSSVGGDTVVMGTITAPSLTNNGQAFLYNTPANGAVLQGEGSTYDSVMADKAGAIAIGIGTGTTVPILPGLSSGTCSSGLALNSSNDMILVSCPGAASAITVGTTTITNGTSGDIEYNNAGTLGELALNGGVTKSASNLQQDGNYGGWALQNCTLAASVGSNLLTVALKDNAGNDPSATSPCNINYRNVTATTGSTTLVQQIAALSISTFATGATLGSSNNTPFRFWVVVFNNAGTNVLALINCSNATTIFPLNEATLASSTAISGAATSAGVFYTPNGTAVTSKAFRILGYIEYNAGLATAGTYGTGPTAIQVFGPGIKKPGDVIQSVYGSSAANSAFSLSITPTSTINLVKMAGMANTASTTAGMTITFKRGATTILTTTQGGGSVTGNFVSAATILDAPGTTSSTAYSTNTSTGTFNEQSIFLEEIMG